MVSIRVKVRASETFLYGGPGVYATTNSPFYLLVHVPDVADKIKIFSVPPDSKPNESLGDLAPGESLLVELKGIVGVKAWTAEDSLVECHFLNRT